jgi:hypothetical protein
MASTFLGFRITVVCKNSLLAVPELSNGILVLSLHCETNVQSVESHEEVKIVTYLKDGVISFRQFLSLHSAF